jgi:hypothetical protein
VPGDVTVELFGTGILTFVAGGVLAAAGVEVGVNNESKIVAAGAGVASIGVLCTTAAAEDDPVDVLVGQFATVA